MRFPWANIVLFLLLIGQLLTGFFGLVSGRFEQRWLLYAHGIGAYAIALTLLWKGVIIFDVYERGKRLGWRRLAFLGLLVLLLATLLSGLVWTFDGPVYLLGFSLVTLHMFLAAPLLAIMLWHSWHYRWILWVREAVGRRAFLSGAALATLGLLVWRSAALVKRAANLQGARRRFTGSYERGSFSGQFPTVSWINDRPAPVQVADWRLLVDGAVENPIALTYKELSAIDGMELDVILDCTGGWYSAQTWQGIPVEELLALVQPRAESRSITFESVTGYRRRFPLEKARQYLLALAVAGQPLSHGHGYPLRLVAPGQRGVNWVKWVTRIRVNAGPAWWQLPLPLQ